MKRVLLGKVSVDSGTMMIIDPCHYVFNPTIEAAFAKKHKENHGGQISRNRKPFAVSFQSGWGDGLYNVYAHINTEINRIVKVEIILIDKKK